MPDEVKKQISLIMAIISAALIVIGIILCVAGVIPLGVAFIVAGAAGLVGTIVANSSAIIQWVKDKFAIIKGLWDSLMNFIWEKFGDKIINIQHKFADFMNWLISKANGILEKIFGSSWASAFFGAIGVNTSNWRIPPVSYLAKGAEIPGGKPFLAVMGDQPRGQTNLEAPEPLLRQIVKEESATNINIRFSGNLAQLARVLNPEIEREQNRSSLWAEAKV
jgi:hypothetical protein